MEKVQIERDLINRRDKQQNQFAVYLKEQDYDTEDEIAFKIANQNKILLFEKAQIV